LTAVALVEILDLVGILAEISRLQLINAIVTPFVANIAMVDTSNRVVWIC
jgi:hypothetical protein